MSRIALALLLAGVAATSACSQPSEAQKSPPARIAIDVTERGFEPATIKVRKGAPVTLVFDRKTDATCAKDIVIHVDDKQTIAKHLPLRQPVEVAVTFPRAGTLTYACSMDMIKGEIFVQ